MAHTHRVEILGGPQDGLVVTVREWQIMAGRVLFKLEGQKPLWWMPLVEHDGRLFALWQTRGRANSH